MAKKFKIAALWMAQETTFATDPDADGSDYKFLKVAGDITFQPNADVLERPGQTNDLTTQDHVVGAQGGTLSFPLEMKASGTAAVSAVAAIASESSPIIEAVLGAVTRGTGTTCTGTGDGSVGTPLTLTSVAGVAVGMMVSVSGETRFVKQIIGSTVVLNKALSSTPAAATVLTASSMFYRSNTAQKSLAFVAKRDGIEYTFLGGKAKFKVSGVTARGTALMQVDVEVDRWSETTKASLPATTLTGITAVKGPCVKGGSVTIDGTEEVTAELEVDPGVELVFQDSIAGTQGRADVEIVSSAPVGVIHPYYGATRLTTFLAGTAVELCVAVGSTTTGFGFYVPRAQYMAPTFENRNGLVGESIGWAARNNGTAVDFTFCQF